jgi:hypothetical protein
VDVDRIWIALAGHAAGRLALSLSHFCPMDSPTD